MDKRERQIMRRRILKSYVSSVVSISLVLFLVGFFAVLTLSVQGLSNYFKQNVKITTIFKSFVSDSSAMATARRIALMPQVKGVEVITKEQGTQEMKQMLGDDFLDVFDANPIPASVDIRLLPQYFESDSIKLLRRNILKEEGVEDVVYQENIIVTMNKNLRYVGIALLIFIALLLFISVMLINNTVRLNIFSRRFSIHTMKLVGATRRFIERPFLRNAVYQGLLSGVIADAVLVMVLSLARSQFFPQLSRSLLNASGVMIVGVGVLLLGVLICVLCTSAVVGRMVSMSVDDLYF